MLEQRLFLQRLEIEVLGERVHEIFVAHRRRDFPIRRLGLLRVRENRLEPGSQRSHDGPIVVRERTLDERGAYIIIIARFIPGGRTAVTFSAGYVHSLTWRRFIVYDVIAGVVWGTYGALLGYFGGKMFEENPLWGILLALGIALSLGLLVEVVRHYRQRRSPA